MDTYFLNWGRQIDMQPSMTYISFAVLPMIFYLLMKVSFHGIFSGPACWNLKQDAHVQEAHKHSLNDINGM